VAAGVAAALAGVWCCGGNGSVPPESPSGGPGDSPGGSPGVSAALVDPAVVGSGTAPGPSSRASLESDAGSCASGPVWLSVRFVALGSGEPERKIVLHEGGAYTVESRSGLARGCLEDPERSKIHSVLETADFTPPPPPEMQCMAVPTREVTVEHPASGRSATYSSPCGKPVHPSVADLVRLVSEICGTTRSDTPR
jgi:hypothetical protein